MAYTFEQPEYVQWYLDNLQPGESFVVIFMTQKGEQRKYEGTLVPSEKRSTGLIAFQTLQGEFKSFCRDRVLYIGKQ